MDTLRCNPFRFGITLKQVLEQRSAVHIVASATLHISENEIHINRSF
jgi:hypothetical protein